MKAIRAKTAGEGELREAVQQWAEAVKARDIDAILRHYTDDARIFDVPAPIEIRGKEQYRKNWESFLGRISGPLECEFKEMEIFAGESLGFMNTLTSIHAADADPAHCPWVRVTVCFQKAGDEWLAVHEHISVPITESAPAHHDPLR